MGISEGPSCPLPLPHHERIILGHGSGGKLTDELISRLFYPCFDNPALRQGNDLATSICKMVLGSQSAPMRMSSGLYSSPAATSAGWPSAGQ